MQIITFDANVFFGANCFLDTRPWETFIEHFSKLGLQIVISEVVFDEVVNNYERSLMETEAALQKSQRAMQKLLSTFSGACEVDINKAVQGYRVDLRNKLDQLGAKFLPYPQLGHKEVVRRALDRKRPFDSKGHNGYRDTLIWLSILEHLKAVPCRKFHFVTKNKTDFYEKNVTELHGDMVNDLQAQSFDVNYFACYNDLGEFNKEHVLPTFDALKKIAEELAGGRFEGFDLTNYVVTGLVDRLKEGGQAYINVDESLSPSAISFIHSGEVVGEVDVWQVHPTQILVIASLKILADIDTTESIDAGIIDRVPCTLTLEVVLDTDTLQVQDVQARDLSPQVPLSVFISQLYDELLAGVRRSQVAVSEQWKRTHSEVFRPLAEDRFRIHGEWMKRINIPVDSISTRDIAAAQREMINSVTLGINRAASELAAANAVNARFAVHEAAMRRMAQADAAARQRNQQIDAAISRLNTVANVTAEMDKHYKRIAEATIRSARVAVDNMVDEMAAIRTQWTKDIAIRNTGIFQDLARDRTQIEEHSDLAARNSYAEVLADNDSGFPTEGSVTEQPTGEFEQTEDQANADREDSSFT